MFEHFLEAQDPVYETVLAELRDGRKRSHWMWFIFPQIGGLGRSEMSRRFAIGSLEEAQAYLAHPVLGARLRECVAAVLAHATPSAPPSTTAHDIFGSPDDMKFRSCLTLFSRAAPGEPLFQEALSGFFGGAADEETLSRI